ncbi:recombinase RecT [Lachnobacterium bovis]|uniref:recombinase RecT n=1 Tax=Lachnobacterium bovis TaxID=140626 RepID=UPI00048A169F|nr:recombinase RecT [Lachnobacterium bovis]SFG65319.1 recombination protein RecT [Lachnospiraceae bacterium C7]
MKMTNTLATQRTQQGGLATYLTKAAVKQQINNIVGGNAQRFTSAIISAVTVNQELQRCSNQSILSGALLGESLKLSPSPQLGQYYLVPFNDKQRGKVAQFQLGYKGYIQLAVRSGYYRKLNVVAIKEGELIKFNPLTEEIDVRLIEDEDIRENTPTIGYYAMFEYTNGFRKAIYWSKARMENHAKKYSAGYSRDLQRGTQYTFWSKDFDAMAYKTMLRQLISKWGIMSIDMQNAVESDMAVINEDGSKDYVDNAENIIDEPSEYESTAEATEQPQDTIKDDSRTNTQQDVASALFSK